MAFGEPSIPVSKVSLYDTLEGTDGIMYTANYIGGELSWVKASKNGKGKNIQGPNCPASQCDIYEVRCGVDGNMYRVEYVNGSIAWVLFETKTTKAKIKSISFTDDELNNGCEVEITRRPFKNVSATQNKVVPKKKYAKNK